MPGPSWSVSGVNRSESLGQVKYPREWAVYYTRAKGIHGITIRALRKSEEDVDPSGRQLHYHGNSSYHVTTRMLRTRVTQRQPENVIDSRRRSIEGSLPNQHPPSTCRYETTMPHKGSKLIIVDKASAPVRLAHGRGISRSALPQEMQREFLENRPNRSHPS